MKKRFLILLILSLFTVNISTNLKAADKIKTKEDLEAFLIGTELKTSGIFDGKTYISKIKFEYDGIFYNYSNGQKTKMLWKPINGNTFKTAQFGYEDYLGWHTYVLDYDNLTYSKTSEKTFDGKVMLPFTFVDLKKYNSSTFKDKKKIILKLPL